MLNCFKLFRLIVIVCCFAVPVALCIYQCKEIRAQEVKSTVKINGKPFEIQIDQSSNTIYVLSSRGVSVINGITNKVITFIDLEGNLVCNNTKSLIDFETEQNELHTKQTTTFQINSLLNRIYVLRETSTGSTFTQGEQDELAWTSLCTDIVVIDSKAKNIIKTLTLHEESYNNCPTCPATPQIGGTLNIISNPTNNIYIASETFKHFINN